MDSTKKIDIVLHLPVEINQKILFYLNQNAISKVVKISKSWKNIFENNLFFKKLCDNYNIKIPKSEDQTEALKKILGKCNSYYKGIWTYYEKLRNNWLHKHFVKAYTNLFECYTENYIAYQDAIVTVIYEYSRRCKCKVFNSERQIIDEFLTLQPLSRIYIARQGELLITIYRNVVNQILVRNIAKREVLWRRTFSGIGTVYNIKFCIRENIIATNIRCTKMISLICLKTGIIKFNLIYPRIIHFISFYDDKLVSVAKDHLLNVWNIGNGTTEYSFQISKNSKVLELDGPYLITCRAVWNIVEKALVCKFNSYMTLKKICKKNTTIFYITYLTTLKAIDYTTGNCITTIKIDGGFIDGITFNSQFIIMACSPRSIERNDMKTFSIRIFNRFNGEFKRHLLLTQKFGAIERPLGECELCYFNATEANLTLEFHYVSYRMHLYIQEFFDFEVEMR